MVVSNTSTEQRTHLRTITSFRVKLKVKNPTTRRLSHIIGKALNLSEGGVGISVSAGGDAELLSLGNKIICELFLASDHSKIRYRAQVAWLTKIQKIRNSTCKIGVKFIEMEGSPQKNNVLLEELQSRKERKTLYVKAEDFLYKRVVKNMLFSSRLGRKSIMGYADSGINFDHIYRNQTKGYTRFGRLVDRVLLNLPAAKATRHRKDRIISLLRNEVYKNISQEKQTKIVDLASGPSRYIVELLSEDLKKDVEVLCLDADRHVLDYGKRLAKDRPILYKKSNVLRIGKHYKSFIEKKGWRPNIVVVSGFYEYLDDETVKTSLRMIKDSLDVGGLLLFVTQRNNPNRKLIEKVGITKAGKSWVLFTEALN